MTPPAAFCSVWAFLCRSAEQNLFVADLPITYHKHNVGNASDFRDRHYIRMPGERSVDVVNDSGRRYTLIFSFTAISQYLAYLSGTMGAGADNGSGCSLGTAISNERRVQYLWRIRQPKAPQGCYDDAWNIRKITDVAVTQFGVEYQLIMPRPIGMPQGIYRGSVEYSIGPGGDLDLGNAVTNLNDTRLVVNFELDVQHDLYVNFPPGSDHAVIEPPGGWMAWLGGRGVPGKLYRDLPLRIFTTGPIRVYKRCQYELGDQCGIRESAGHLVGVDVSLTLPAGLQHSGNPVSRLGIPTRQAAALLIEPLSSVWGQSGQLHFEVAGSSVPPMLAHPGSRYEGLVTVVFEAEI
ncbi:hypothetical protein GLGCALEP_01582 [Pseudomonas sp. MM221]|nr:hypothetical protein GLGCALEP_01582 [Pseudomonas sp. MM221]